MIDREYGDDLIAELAHTWPVSVRALEATPALSSARNTPAGGLTPPAAFLQTAAASPTTTRSAAPGAVKHLASSPAADAPVVPRRERI